MSKQKVSNLSSRPHSRRFADYLNEQGYAEATALRHIAAADRFQRYLCQCRVAIEAAKPADVESYLKKELRKFSRFHGHSPARLDVWYRKRRVPVHILLRLVQGQWPPVVHPTTLQGIFHQQIMDGCARWLAECRGLAVSTIAARRSHWRHFLEWLGERGSQEGLSDLTVAELDAYFEDRAPMLRRSSRAELALCLRCFLSYLYMNGHLARDLSQTAIGPTMYAFEAIPSALTAEQIRTVVEFARQDRTAKGLRRFAIVMLLSEYGLRAGEVVHLRLEDIDWRHDFIRVRHSKTGAETLLPLLPSVGSALLDYLRHSRPKTAAREVFVRIPAPHVPLCNGSSLYTMIQRLLDKAGVRTEGKRGPHTFRHAHAISLLRAAVSPKAIGDILGHRSATSTKPYLKLATEDLRAVCLEVPTKVNS